MYTMSHPGPPMNGGSGVMGVGALDGSGTINPAALNTSASHAGTTSSLTQAVPRGTKRSRSPDVGDAQPAGRGENDVKRPKQARPSHTSSRPGSRISESPRQSVPPSVAPPVQTPQSTNSITQPSPTHSSPTKLTPTKPTVLKALPTVRDHTTDQLNAAGDEYIPREFDAAGEAKITANGQLLDGRQYKCRTFLVPQRGDKLFMLATECARVLNYRDSYLLFNKNRSLHKIIANQAEKDDLIQQEILPYSYRSRQIAIVTARSMFRQFGSRVVVNGRRVRDDYWESKARKQGFTEEDAAGEKRPGAAKAREAAAIAAANNVNTLASLHHGEIIYSNGPGLDGYPGLLPPGVSQAHPRITDDMLPRDYSGVQRPRHEPSGAPYVDLTKSTNSTELLQQATIAADINKTIRQQSDSRADWINEQWRRPHDPPPTSEETTESLAAPATTQTLQSPRPAPPVLPQPGMPHQQPTSSHMITPQHAYTQAGAPNPMVQSPVQAMHNRSQLQGHRSSPNLGGGNTATPQHNAYAYQQSQMWPPPQPQPSPLSQSHNMQQYGQQPSAMAQQPNHGMPQHSPMHQPPQLHHSSSTGSLHGTPMMGYQGMPAMPSAGYPGMPGRAQNPYQPSPSPQQYMQQSAAQQHPGMQGWAGQPSQQGWQGFQ